MTITIGQNSLCTLWFREYIEPAIMEPDAKIPPSENQTQPNGIPPLLNSPPPTETQPRSLSLRPALAILLSLCLAAFIADAVVSLADDFLILLFNLHLLTPIRGLVFLAALVSGALVYLLMGVTPMVPKRFFLPVALFNPIAGLLLLPALVYAYFQTQRIALWVSIVQVALAFGVLFAVQGGWTFGWPFVPESRLKPRLFSWRNLIIFVFANVFVLLPAILIYLFFCTAAAVNHVSDGFVSLRPGGFFVQARKFVRDDGKVVQLFPMAHVAEGRFYHDLVNSFPTNSVILLEGVTDEKNLLTNKVTYKRMARSLGVAEQHEAFNPTRGTLVHADVDVSDFSTNTISLLNFIMMIHAKGLTPERLVQLLQYSPEPHFEAQLFDDILRKRNERVLKEIHEQLSNADFVIVPWGAAHMPGIAREIQRSGFKLDESKDYEVLHFGPHSKAVKSSGKSSPPR